MTALRVGMVGVQPGRGWAARAHLPALRSLGDAYHVVGVANTSRASADTAAREFDIPRAFDSVDDLVADPEIDLVVTTVKVPYHFGIVSKAIAAGKNIFCEWPLGNGLAEAEEMARQARERGVAAFVGTQARTSPGMEYLADLVADGYVGEVLSTSIVARGGSWGPSIPETRTRAYVLDVANGATMLTIPFGHTMAALRDVLPPVHEVTAQLTTLRTEVLVTETGDRIAQTAPDQVLVQGTLEGGAPISIHYRGGAARPGTDGFFWVVNGTEGDLEVSGAHTGSAQIIELRIRGAHGEGTTVEPLVVPERYFTNWPTAVVGAAAMPGDGDYVAGNVARLYARISADLATESRTAPTFEDALATHRLIEAVERAAASGSRVRVDGA